MDVVKRMIEEAGGSINVSSTPGKGSKFSVRLPKSVTTQIIKGYLVKVGQRSYVLPLSRIHETAKIEKREVKSLMGKGQFIMRHGKVLPVISLAEHMRLSDESEIERDHEIIVTIDAGKKRFAVIVTEVLGVQQVVHRNIQGMQASSKMISGGALMGDGSVALIIDVEKLYEERQVGDVAEAAALQATSV